MLRDITLGQYYPTDSVLHRLDPRTKLFGTLVYIVTLFLADSLFGYAAAALFLVLAIKLSNVPVKFMAGTGDVHGSAADFSRDGFHNPHADDDAEPAHGWAGKEPGLFEPRRRAGT